MLPRPMNSAPMVAAPKKVSLELNAIFENATVGIVFTRNRKLMQANRLCAEMFGYDLEAFIGQPALILYESPEAYSARCWASSTWCSSRAARRPR